MRLALERGRGVGLGRVPEPAAVFLASALSIVSQTTARWDHLAFHLGFGILLLAANRRLPIPKLFLFSLIMTALPILLGNWLVPDEVAMDGIAADERPVFMALRRISTMLYGFAWLFSTTPARVVQACYWILRPFSLKLALTTSIVIALYPRLVRTFRDQRLSLGLRALQLKKQYVARSLLARLNVFRALAAQIGQLKLLVIATAARTFDFIPEVVAALQSFGPRMRKGSLPTLESLSIDPPEIRSSSGSVTAPLPVTLAPGALLEVRSSKAATATAYLEFAARIVPAVDGDARSGFRWNGRDLVADHVPLAQTQGRIGFHAPSWGLCPLGVTLRQHGALAGLSPALSARQAQRWGIAPLLDREIQTLSGGQQLRAYLSCALAGEREVMVLNDPFDQLDRDACEQLINDLNAFRSSGSPIVIAADSSGQIASFGSPSSVVDVATGGSAAEQRVGIPPVPRVPRDALPTPISSVEIPSRHLQLHFDPALSLEAGTLVALAGPNGVGKSSLFEAMAGVIHSDLILPPRWRVGYVMQAPRANAVALVARDEFAIANQRVPINEAVSQVLASIREALAGSLDRPAAQLSIFETRLVALAAMAQGATLLLCDEPDVYLSRSERVQVGRVLRALANAGLAVLVATHSSSLLAEADAVVNVKDASR